MKCGKTVVATFGEADKAEAVKTRLEQAGIPAVVGDESKLQKFIYLSRPLASQKVYVNDEDCEKAVQFLMQAHAQDHILDGEVRCPDCGSPRVEYPQYTRKFMMTTLVELACWLHLVEKRFYCMDCHFTWPMAVRLRKESDILNWPVKDGAPVKREGF